MNYWLLIIGMGLITVTLRASLIVTAGRVEMPRLVTRALWYVPPAVLTAIFVPEILFNDAGLALDPLANPRIIAGIVAIVVAWFTRNVIITIVVGLAVLWFLTAQIGLG
jgi:branched-subunit amino acid transport protein